MNQGASTSQNNCAEKQKHHLSRWVNIPEQWVNIKQNGGSTWIRIYTADIIMSRKWMAGCLIAEGDLI